MNALILAPFDQQVINRLKEKIGVIHESWTETKRLSSTEELSERIQKEDIGILIVEADFVFEEVFEAVDKLRFLGVCRAATNHVDIEAASKTGVLVVNTPARNAAAVAELALGLMLSLARHIPEAHSFVKSGRWDDPVGGYIAFRGVELAGKTAGIVGLGAIGREVAKRLNGLDMRVLAYDPFVSPERAAECNVTKAGLEQLMAESDFISIHCPVSPETSGLIGQDRISLMKPTAYLINTAGWEIVDESALLNALERKRIAGAALDVYQTHPLSLESPLLNMENVVLTPHIGGATTDTVERYSMMMAEEIEAFLSGRRPRNLINPQAWK